MMALVPMTMPYVYVICVELVSEHEKIRCIQTSQERRIKTIGGNSVSKIMFIIIN